MLCVSTCCVYWLQDTIAPQEEKASIVWRAVWACVIYVPRSFSNVTVTMFAARRGRLFDLLQTTVASPVAEQGGWLQNCRGFALVVTWLVQKTVLFIGVVVVFNNIMKDSASLHKINVAVTIVIKITLTWQRENMLFLLLWMFWLHLEGSTIHLVQTKWHLQASRLESLQCIQADEIYSTATNLYMLENEARIVNVCLNSQPSAATCCCLLFHAGQSLNSAAINLLAGSGVEWCWQSLRVRC